MQRYLLVFLALTAAPAFWACGGGSSDGSSTSSPSVVTPTTPTTTATPTPAPAPVASAPATVSIVGSSGNGAFSPNPIPISGGGLIVWKNNDSITHHIVVDGGAADLGDIAPGASSRSFTVANATALTFHCTIHPTMVGSINGAAAPAPPDPGQPYPYSSRH